MSLSEDKIQQSNDLARLANAIDYAGKIKELYQAEEPDFFRHILLIDRDSLESLISSLQRIKDKYPKKETYKYDRYLVVVNSDNNPVVVTDESLRDEFALHMKSVFLDAFSDLKTQEYTAKLDELNS